jgi:hypothetical protein
MKLVVLFLLNGLTSDLIKHGFNERKVYTYSEIIHDDHIGCSEEYKNFYKQTLMQKFDIDFDQIYFKCQTVIDDKNIKHSKRYTEIKV